MKKLLIVILMLCSLMTKAQFLDDLEIGIFTGSNFNYSSRYPEHPSNGWQFGIQAKTPLFAKSKIQLRTNYREMQFHAEIHNLFSIGPPRNQNLGPKIFKDEYQTLDVSLLIGLNLFSCKTVSLDFFIGAGYGAILNATQYHRIIRLEGLRKYFLLGDIGLEIDFPISKSLNLTLNPQLMSTSFYRIQYRSNESYQINAIFSYIFHLS